MALTMYYADHRSDGSATALTMYYADHRSDGD
jgi:hypothetical protein